MNAEAERELAVVLAEEKAKVVLGEERYRSLPYGEWVDELKSFAQTQRCPDCGGLYDLEYPEEEIWGWFVESQTDELDELEVVEFLCEGCVDEDDDRRELSHPKSFGVLIFRRSLTGTFPFDDDDEEGQVDEA